LLSPFLDHLLQEWLYVLVLFHSVNLLSLFALALLLEENEQLRAENKELRRMLFSSKRERFVPVADDGQLRLALEGEPTEPVIQVKQTISYGL
jgi:regulator of replication initiation timing